MARKSVKYSSDLPRRMYGFFAAYSGTGAPSFDKFARSIGATLAELESFKRHRDFDRAYRECGEIRRDYLIDTALTKRHDPSFTKFLLISEFGMGEHSEADDDRAINVTLEVI